MDELEKIVEHNNKKRFEFNEDKSKIRASQGHSIKINLGYIVQHYSTALYKKIGRTYRMMD